ncbi:hypothetical protein ACJZ2D_007145 [Fusarium nematophilum]
MAEVLGIVAGVAQLLDLSLRVVLASSQLYTKLKNVPGEIETLKKSTQQFIDLLRIISFDFSIPAEPGSVSLQVAHHVTSLLHDTVKESGGLARLLEDLSIAETNTIKRTWATVVSAKKEKELTDRCHRIESFKSSLQLWHQHHSSARMLQQLNQIKTYQLALQSNVGLLTQQCSTITDSNQSIVTQLGSLTLSGPPSSGQARRRRRRQPAFGTSGCTCSSVTQTSAVSFSALQLFLTKQDSHSETCSSRDTSTSWSCGLRVLKPRIQVMLGLQLGGWALSMCGRISPHNVVDPDKSPAFIAVKNAIGEIKDTFGISIFQTQLFPGSELRLVGSDGLRTLTVVQEVDVLQRQAVTSTFESLLRSILQAFESGEASPTDQTPQGATVLHLFVLLAGKCAYFQEQNYHLLDSIAELLFAGNADPNADIRSGQELPAFFGYCRLPLHATPLCIMASEIASPWCPPEVSDHIRLDRILVKHGCDTSRFLRDSQRSGNRRMASIIARNSIVLEGWFPCFKNETVRHLSNAKMVVDEQSPIRVAVIEKSEKELRHLVSIEGASVEDRALVRLAIGWPTGLRILLDAGADPSGGIFHAIREQHLPSVEVLLEYDCPMFVDNGEFVVGLLEIALIWWASPGVVALLIERLAERRKDLLRLALENLSHSWLAKLGYGKEQGKLLVDRHALQIFEELQMHHVDVPKALRPGNRTTVYHTAEMPPTLARKLYDAGFRAIDEPDKDGITPLLSLILRGHVPFLEDEHDMRHQDLLRLSEWYLGHGATLPRSPNFQTILQFSETWTGCISARIWIGKHGGLCGALQVFRQLDEQTGHQHDSCSCWCTMAGCTPVGIVLRKKQWGAYGDEQVYRLLRRRRWLFYLPRYSLLGLSVSQQCFADICRLELFDRLGMAHTCCHFLDQGRVSPKYRFRGMIRAGIPSMPLEERRELQEEDRYLKLALDSYVDLYLDLLQKHRGGFESFWIAWWLALEDHLPPEIPKDRETDYPRIKIPGVCDPGHPDEGRDLSSYEPNIEAITNMVKEYSSHLNSEGIEKVLGQLAPNKVEQGFNSWYLKGWLSTEEDEEG